MKKRILSLVLALSMMISLFSASTADPRRRDCGAGGGEWGGHRRRQWG